MDKIDRQIIEELMSDARKPFSKIAKKIGVSMQTVKNRYNEMKANGIVQHCSISIDLQKIGYTGEAYLLFTSSYENILSEAIELLRKTENIVIATRAIGDFEGYGVLVFKDIKDLYRRILQIKKLHGIGEIDISFSIPGARCYPPCTSIEPNKKPL